MTTYERLREAEKHLPAIVDLIDREEGLRALGRAYEVFPDSEHQQLAATMFRAASNARERRVRLLESCGLL